MHDTVCTSLAHVSRGRARDGKPMASNENSTEGHESHNGPVQDHLNLMVVFVVAGVMLLDILVCKS